MAWVTKPSNITISSLGGSATSVATTNNDHSSSAVHKLEWVCSYSSSGVLSISHFVTVTGSWGKYDTENSRCGVTVNGSTYYFLEPGTAFSDYTTNNRKQMGNTGTWNIGADTTSITVNVSEDFYSGGYGPGSKLTESFTITVPKRQTNPVAGTTRASYSGNTFSISWSGFQAGTNNPIDHYELWYQESTNNSTWGSRVLLTGNTTSTSYSWTGGTWNNYYRFCAVAIGANGGYSSIDAYSSSVRKYATACGAPSTINRSPSSTVYIRDTVTISWSGASNGTNNTINGYRLQYGTSTSSYSTKSVTTTSTSSFNTFVPTSSGTWYYRIQTKGTAGSSYYGTSTWRSLTVSVIGAPSTCRYVITEDGSNDVTGDTTAPSSRATIVNKTFKGTWTVGAGATSYQIRLMRRNDANTAWEEYSSTYYTSTTNSYTFSLPIRSSYPGTRRNNLWYNVRSVRNGYYSAWVGPSYGFSRSACVKIYNGSTWKNGAVWIFNGNKWIPARYVKLCNGSAWKDSKLY